MSTKKTTTQPKKGSEKEVKKTSTESATKTEVKAKDKKKAPKKDEPVAESAEVTEVTEDKAKDKKKTSKKDKPAAEEVVEVKSKDKKKVAKKGDPVTEVTEAKAKDKKKVAKKDEPVTEVTEAVTEKKSSGKNPSKASTGPADPEPSTKKPLKKMNNNPKPNKKASKIAADCRYTAEILLSELASIEESGNTNKLAELTEVKNEVDALVEKVRNLQSGYTGPE